MWFEREVRSKTFDLILFCNRVNDDSVQSHCCMSCCFHHCQREPHCQKRTNILCCHRAVASCVAVTHGHEELRLNVDFLPMMLPCLSPLFFRELFNSGEESMGMNDTTNSTVKTFHMGESFMSVSHECESRILGHRWLPLTFLGKMVCCIEGSMTEAMFVPKWFPLDAQCEWAAFHRVCPCETCQQKCG